MGKPIHLFHLAMLFLLPKAAFTHPGQDKDSVMFRSIYNYELLHGSCYSNLASLCTTIGPRLSGSPQAAKAVDWAKNLMNSYGFDSVYLMPVMVPHWVRGDKEVAKIIAGVQEVPVNSTALGNSVGTGKKGLRARVVEVKSLAELDSLGEAGVKGKIVFFNGRMDPALINRGRAYGLAGEQRNHGPARAAHYGAVGVVVRSLTSRLDHYPHTGATSYEENVPKIPAIAISTLDAEMLESLIHRNDKPEFYFKDNCEMLDDVSSYNVIGEIRGSVFPGQVILVGGHLDSWDLAQGANDDGTGVVHSIEVLKIFKSLGYTPQRTIRVVLFMNEENGLRGGIKYGQEASSKKETHIAAIESDTGGFSPRGFGMDGTDEKVKKMQSWAPLFNPYGVDEFVRGGGGADISSLKTLGVPLIGFRPDIQKYFKFHHSPIDTIDNVDERELELGSATIAALVYLIDTYGM